MNSVCRFTTTHVISIVAYSTFSFSVYATSGVPGVLLQDLTWQEAEKVMNPKTVVVLPLGAAAKEHGPHLKLKNDMLIAEYLRDRLIEKAEVVVAPTLNYHFYPAFLEYPGSTSLRIDTARDLVIDIVKSLARFGPKRFYVLNTGISTVRPLQLAADFLAKDGLLLGHTDVEKATVEVEKEIIEQSGGSLAEEIETSMMLVIAPKTVEMKKAVKDFNPKKGPLTRDPKNSEGTYSPSGVWGDPTLATKAKGEKLVAATVAHILRDIEHIRSSPLPAGR